MAQSLLLPNFSIGNQQRLLSVFSQKDLRQIVERNNSDYRVTTLFSVNLLRLYILSFLNHSSLSLRSICSYSSTLVAQAFSALKTVKLSTISKRNGALPYTFFQDVFELLRSHITTKHFKNDAVFNKSICRNVFDTTFMRVSFALCPWATAHQNGKGLFKLGLRIQDGFDIPETVIVETKSMSDNTRFEDFIDFTKKAQTYIFDRGFYTIAILNKIHRSKNYFVTRCHTQYKITEVNKPITKSYKYGSYLRITEQKVLIGSGKNQCKKPFRLISVILRDSGKMLTFLTNRNHLAAATVADLYKKRWQIEPFFKWLKQSLKINKFIACSFNGVMIQIYMALIVHLLIVLFKIKSKAKYTNRIDVLRHMQTQMINNACYAFYEAGALASRNLKGSISIPKIFKHYIKEQLNYGGH